MKRNTLTITLLLFVFAIALMIQSCKDKEEGGDNDDLYMVTTYSFFHNYYKPKKANLFAFKGVVIGDWLSNEMIRYSPVYQDVYHGDKSSSTTDDYAQEYAEHYFFLDENGIKKYVSLQEKKHRRVIIDKNDIISPFKEYAAYYGDTTHLTNHDAVLISGRGVDHACVMPLLAIDVICNKNFDTKHLAGSKLNDIMFYKQSLEMYNYLQDKKKQGEELYSGIGSCKEFDKRRLSLIPENPIYLMESKFYIMFDHAPATPGTYEFTIKFTFGPDPLSGETVDIEPVTVSMEF
ncbi:MAG: hypothetical protein J6T60_03600 [Bacteroidales bacterium]|nr:hypothetical protein [Bacteroidales bacterium]